jgi:NADH-quinone oxidoreductase subunit A
MLPFPEYVPIFILIGLAILFAALVTGVTFILGPKKPSAAKLAPYESGIREIEPVKHRFPVKYLVTGMLFIIFDIEAVSFYPLAVLLKSDLKVFGLIELLIFLAILLIAYVYVWRKGAFKWE